MKFIDIKNLVIALCICVLYSSCKKEEKNNRADRNEEKELIITRAPVITPVSALEANELKYKLILPETLRVNKSYTAIIEFESDFDKIVDPMQYAVKLDSTKDRLVRFFYSPYKLPSNNNQENKKIEPIYVSNKKFKVENIVFKEKGNYMFEGYIFDEIRYIFYDKKGKRDSIHFDQRRQMIKKKIVVVE